MPIGSSLRFRLIMGLVKQAIFAVDRIPFRLPIPHRQSGPPPFRSPIRQIGTPLTVPSGDNLLSGWFVDTDTSLHAAVLLLHGIGDRLIYWRKAQQRLAESGIASLVFSYSGYPGSGGTTTPEQLTIDAHAAYRCLRDRLPARTPVFLLGFSLGTGLAAEVAADLQPPPAGLILCEAYSTLREAARRIARPAGFFARLLPDLWRTTQTIRQLKMPLLIMHSTADALFPVAMAQEIYAAAVAAGVAAELQVLDGHLHNAPYLTVPEDYWTAILSFIARASELECCNGTRRDQ
jgi:fermentation-respiration switch protein FrsA (DUF1100 family)